ncbi:putative gpi transamidase component gpi16 [Phaeomoniella chlamydospora]|uniref:Putative gpi transamidase component gpi16 n=1 Tax=Phaeomoniella chlamydospora TaxID=158046 RepID=A0A0G2ENQ4_PHACM|nr:putative gpi transamidase component gpi16 [Phaeomoniella chlamydospora]
MSRVSLLFFGLLASLILCAPALSDYHERLTLYPLPLGSLLASFDFRSNETLSAFQQENFRYFPRSLGQILKHSNTKELHLRFSTGRWDPEVWGERPWNGVKEGGTGVELWAWIEAPTEDQAFEKWTSLTQLLSGLFCASLNFVDSTRTTRPVVSFGAKGDHNQADGGLHLLHGVLPGEVVCTENLTPFLKLLPCKGKAGISSLLDGHKVFDAAWQSMAIDIRPVCPSDRSECVVEIQQTIDIVLDIERSKRPHDDPIPRPIRSNIPWSLQELFGRPIAGSCPLIEEVGPNSTPVCLKVPHDRKVLTSAGAIESKSLPGASEERYYHLLPDQDFDITLPETEKEQIVSPGKELVHAERTITGHGAAQGGIRTILINPSFTDSVDFVYFESLPWFMRPFVHTLRAEITETKLSSPPSSEIIQGMYYRPAVDRERGTQLELIISIPPASTVTLIYDFEKAILRYTEYPPDANRGFNVAPAVIRILSQGNATDHQPDVYIRTTSLLLPLPTPDFSMPYNVIILTSTVIALAFGSIYNMLIRRFVAADEVPRFDPKKIKGVIIARLTALKAKFGGDAKTQKVE